ncbi:DYW_deaminase domain-containing protein [Psidium guajava]|nr:DYW_deaminase domain-containing protein [Psidium guajava]
MFTGCWTSCTVVIDNGNSSLKGRDASITFHHRTQSARLGEEIAQENLEVRRLQILVKGVDHAIPSYSTILQSRYRKLPRPRYGAEEPKVIQKIEESLKKMIDDWFSIIALNVTKLLVDA